MKKYIVLFLLVFLVSCSNSLSNIFIDKNIIAQNNETKIFEDDFDSKVLYTSWSWKYIGEVKLSDNWEHFLLEESSIWNWYKSNLLYDNLVVYNYNEINILKDFFISNTWKSYVYFQYNDNKNDIYEYWYKLNLNWTIKRLWEIEKLWNYPKWFFLDSEYFNFSYKPEYKKQNVDKSLINIDWNDVIESSVYKDGSFIQVNKTKYKHKVKKEFEAYDGSYVFDNYEINNDSIRVSNKWDLWFLLWKDNNDSPFKKEYVFINWKIIETGYFLSDFNRNSFRMSLDWSNYIIRQYRENKWDYFITKYKTFWPFVYDELNRVDISNDWNLIVISYKKDDKYYYQLIEKVTKYKKNNNIFSKKIPKVSYEFELTKLYWPYDDTYEPELSQKWWWYILYYEKYWEAGDKTYAIVNWNDVWYIEDIQISNKKDSYIYSKKDIIYIIIKWKEYKFNKWKLLGSKFYIHNDGNGFTYIYHNKVKWKTLLKNFRIK